MQTVENSEIELRFRLSVTVSSHWQPLTGVTATISLSLL